MLAVHNLTYKAGAHILLENITVCFVPGRLHLVVGPNGAGKSTLIKTISGQLKPASGTVIYGDKKISDLSVSALARMRAVLSQSTDIAFPLTVQETVMMGRYPHFTGRPAKEDIAACEQAMAFFDVENMAERNYHSLSGGEQQRVHFARVMAQLWYPAPGQCRYLILDEPLTFLDIYYQFEFMSKVKLLLEQNDFSVIGVVHDLNLAAKFADDILLLHRGKIMANGKPDQVLTLTNIEQAYKLRPVIRKENDQLHLLF